MHVSSRSITILWPLSFYLALNLFIPMSMVRRRNILTLRTSNVLKARTSHNSTASPMLIMACWIALASYARASKADYRQLDLLIGQFKGIYYNSADIQNQWQGKAGPWEHWRLMSTLDLIWPKIYHLVGSNFCCHSCTEAVFIVMCDPSMNDMWAT